MLHIRKMIAGDYDAMHAVWERSVRATHSFLLEEDIAFFSPLVREIFGLDLEFWVVIKEERLLGFMALDTAVAPVKLEALFVDPAYFRKGAGRALAEKAMELYGPLVLDVNEQNPGAREFYLRLRFTETGRSPLDGAGKPFPLIHMRCEAKQH